MERIHEQQGGIQNISLNTLCISIQKLLSYTLSELEELWIEAASQSLKRQTWIKDLDCQLVEIEESRMNKVKKISCFSIQIETVSLL